MLEKFRIVVLEQQCHVASGRGHARSTLHAWGPSGRLSAAAPVSSTPAACGPAAPDLAAASASTAPSAAPGLASASTRAGSAAATSASSRSTLTPATTTWRVRHAGSNLGAHLYTETMRGLPPPRQAAAA